MCMPIGLPLVFLVALAISLVPWPQHARPLPIPDIAGIDRVVVSAQPERPKDGEVVIKNAKRIKRLVAFLKERNNGWHKPWDTFPTPGWTVSFEKGKEMPLVLWLGPNWLGGREGRGAAADNRLRSLSKKESDELFEILGIAD
jgi:hypothetical protein